MPPIKIRRYQKVPKGFKNYEKGIKRYQKDLKCCFENCVGSLTSILIFCWSLVTWRLKNLLLLPSLLRYFFVETPGGNLCCFANRFLGVDTKVISISYCTYSTLPLKLLQKKLWLREKGHVIKQNTLNRLSGSTDQHCRANNAINSSDILSRQQQWNIIVNSTFQIARKGKGT